MKVEHTPQIEMFSQKVQRKSKGIHPDLNIGSRASNSTHKKIGFVNREKTEGIFPFWKSCFGEIGEQKIE